MRTSTPPTGRKIVLELVNEMEERLYPLLYRTLAPSLYHVYLHPEDYREIEAITPLIVTDAQQGLNARVDELNRRGRWFALVSSNRPAIDVPRGGWEIYVHPDANGEIARGAMGIVSSLSLPAQPRFDGGTPTTRIARTVVTGNIRRTAVAEERSAAPENVAAMQSVPATGGATSALLSEPTLSDSTPPTGPIASTVTAERTRATAPIDASATGGLARLAYVDDQGPHVFVIRKDMVSIGRGGSAHWVDVQVASTARVSREHCRIRRNADGRFFVQDISSWGTSVDGQTVRPFLRQIGEQVQETGEEQELPRRARIQLADAVVIEFDAEAG